MRKLLLLTSLTLLIASTATAQYCASGATSTADSEIDEVVLNGDVNSINNNTAGVCATYTDFTGLTAADVTQGSNYSVSVTLGTCSGDYGKYGRVYIDWNQDQDFADANEDLGGIGSFTTTTTGTINFTVPATATIGNTRMRVICIEGASAVSDPCASFTWGETEDYTVSITASGPMSYTSSTTTQNTGDVQVCASNVQVVGLEVVTTGSSTPLDLTQIRMNMTGTTDITDVTNIDIFYTGTSSSFAASNLFASATPATGTFNVNGTQTLSAGTNYFWIAYDLAAGGTVSNVIDARVARITVDGTNQFPTVTNPAGNREIVACNGSPGGVSNNIQSWLKADDGTYVTNGTTATAWTDQSMTGNSATGGGGTSNPVYRRNTGQNVNFNAGIDFDGSNDYMDLPANTIATADGEYSIYAVAVPGVTHSATNPGKIIMAGEFVLAGSTDMWVAMDVRPTYQVNHGWNQNDIISANGMCAQDEPILICMSYGNSASAEREAWMTSTTGNNYMTDNPSVPHLNNGTVNLIGKASPDNEYFDGLINEVVVFNEKHSQQDREQVESYLALKYGLTLDHNYYSGSGSTVWDYTSNAGFNNNIAGIGRDDASSLDQRQSKSENSGALLTIGHGSALGTDNYQNNNSFSTDETFLVWGNDNGSSNGQWQPIPLGTLTGDLIESMMIRSWQVQETNSPGTVVLQWDLSSVIGVAGALGANDLQYVRLLVDTDGDFTSGATSISPTSFNNLTDIVTFTHDFTAGTGFFFTIASTNYLLAPLPVEMTAFDAFCDDQEVTLNWTTASESGIAHYDIERSADGENFEVVANVPSLGQSTSAQNYSYSVPADKDAIYYRLSTTDYNSSREVATGLVSATCQADPQVNAYAADGQAVLEVNFPQLETVTISIYDLSGKVVYSKQATFESGYRRFSLPVNLSTGIYSLRLQAGDYFYHQKLMWR